MHFKINVKQTLRLYHILNHWLTSNVKLLGNGPTTYVTDNTCEHISSWIYAEHWHPLPQIHSNKK